MKTKFSSKLLLSKEDFATIYDKEYIWFLPCLVILVCVFAALSPLFKGIGFLPVFIILTLLFIAFIICYNLKNKSITDKINLAFKEKELINYDIDFLEDKTLINLNGEKEEISYKSILKIEEYESLYLIYTNNKAIPVSKEIGAFKDASDFIDFILKNTKIKRKKVKKIHLRKQKAYISIIVLGVFAFATLLPLIYMIAYNLFDYARFGMR